MVKEPGRYYIAVDGGASKTHFCLHNIDTGSEQEFFSSGTNFKNPETSARKNLIDKGVLRIFTETGISPEEVRGMVMGLAGCDCEEDRRYFLDLADVKGRNTRIPAVHYPVSVGSDTHTPGPTGISCGSS